LSERCTSTGWKAKHNAVEVQVLGHNPYYYGSRDDEPMRIRVVSRSEKENEQCLDDVSPWLTFS
jgi:hypothetical protein